MQVGSTSTLNPAFTVRKRCWDERNKHGTFLQTFVQIEKSTFSFDDSARLRIVSSCCLARALQHHTHRLLLLLFLVVLAAAHETGSVGAEGCLQRKCLPRFAYNLSVCQYSICSPNSSWQIVQHFLAFERRTHRSLQMPGTPDSIRDQKGAVTCLGYYAKIITIQIQPL